jgi:hypothetical protein
VTKNYDMCIVDILAMCIVLDVTKLWIIAVYRYAYLKVSTPLSDDGFPSLVSAISGLC